jgi:WD40 repeat protein
MTAFKGVILMASAAVVVGLLAFGQMGPDPVRTIIRDFPYGVECLAFSPDGKTIATGTHHSGEGKDALRLWEAATGKEICRLGEDYRFGCSAVAFSSDGKTLVANDAPGGRIQLWDLATRKVRVTFKRQEGFGRCFAVSPASNRLAVTDEGSTLHQYDMETGKQLLTMEGNLDAIRIAYSSDGKLLAASTAAGLVALWDATSGKRHGTLRKHEKAVHSIAFAPDDKTLYSVGEDRLLVIWDTTTATLRRTILLQKSGMRGYLAVDHAALSSDGKTMALVGQNTVRLFDVASESYWPGVQWGYQRGRQRCVVFSPDGKLLATGSGSGGTSNSVYFYNVPPRAEKPKE